MNITINYRGIDFDVEYDYQPFEPADRGHDAQYPGCDESIDRINEFTHKGTDFLEWIEDSEDEIKELILEKMHENNF
jgi:hypothetical protein